MMQLYVQWLMYIDECGPACECAAATLRQMQLLARLEWVKRQAQERRAEHARRQMLVDLAAEIGDQAQASLVADALTQVPLDRKVTGFTIESITTFEIGADGVTMMSSTTVSIHEAADDEEGVVDGPDYAWTMRPSLESDVPGSLGLGRRDARMRGRIDRLRAATGRAPLMLSAPPTLLALAHHR